MTAHWRTEDLSALLEGELPLLRRRAAEHHLEDCAACQRKLAMLMRTIAAAKSSAPPASNAAEMWQAVEAGIAHQPQQRRAQLQQRYRIVRTPRWNGALAALAAVVIVAVLYGRSVGVAPDNRQGLHSAVGGAATNQATARPAAARDPVRNALLDAQAEVAGGIEEMKRELRGRPEDRALRILIDRAEHHMADLTRQLGS